MYLTILQGDCIEKLRELPDESVQTCITSPPYWGLRDYGVEGQLGLESTPEEYVQNLVEVFQEVKRVLRDDGTLWLNLGDSYAANRTYQVKNGIGAKEHIFGRGSKVPPGLKQKDLVGIPWMVAFALRADGWYLRSDIIWNKPNPMPERVTDRPTKAHEHVFLLSKSANYYYDHKAIKEPVSQSTISRLTQNVMNQKGSDRANGGAKTNGNMKAVGGSTSRNRRTVWTVSTKPFKGAHFATFPKDLILPCVLAGAPEYGTVLDPFFGAGTTALVALENLRSCIGIELNPAYVEIAKRRLKDIMWIL